MLAFCVGADDRRDGSVGIDMIASVLRIVLDNKDGNLFPKLTLGDRFDGESLRSSSR
jgi:hypothetical protein